MKRAILFLPLVAGVLLAAACSDESGDALSEITQTDRQTEVEPIELSEMEMAILKQDAAGTPKVSVDEAATIASEFLGQNGGTSLSKSLAAPKCDAYLRKHTSLKKAASDESDTLFYLFNYGEDNGYAVVSADVRVPQPVLAYSDEGNISLDTDNPGLNIFYDLAEQYVDESIAELEESRDSLEQSICDKFGIETDTTKSLSKTWTQIQKFKITSLCNTYTTTSTKEVKPLIETNWHQDSPYNNRVDNCYPAGCVAIATCQLMCYWQYPSVVNNIVMDWKYLIPNTQANSYMKEDSLRNDQHYIYQVSSLVSYVGKSISTEYSKDGSGADVNDALSFLRKLGYNAPKKEVSYDYGNVTSSIDSYRPVMIGGYATKKSNGGYSVGHEWLADGYFTLTYRSYDKITYGVVYVDENGQGKFEMQEVNGGSTTLSTEKYLHFNWGWGSGFNGYYANNVFQVSKRYKLDNETIVSNPKYTTPDYYYQYLITIANNIHK